MARHQYSRITIKIEWVFRGDYVSGAHNAEQKTEWHCQREQSMLARINEYGKDAQALLIILGFVHVQHLAAVPGPGGTVPTNRL